MAINVWGLLPLIMLPVGAKYAQFLETGVLRILNIAQPNAEQRRLLLSGLAPRGDFLFSEWFRRYIYLHELHTVVRNCPALPDANNSEWAIF